MEQQGGPRTAYLVVLALLGMVFTILPGVFVLVMLTQVLPRFEDADPAIMSRFLALSNIGSFLIAPCLLFVAVYYFGKRAAHRTDNDYLQVALSIFIGSVVGYVVYVLALAIADRESLILNFDFWLNFAIAATSGGVKNLLTGIAALAVAGIGARRTSEPPGPM